MRPDIFRAVIGLSVPYLPQLLCQKESISIKMKMSAGERDYYTFKNLIAEADLEADIRKTMLGFLYTISGDIVKDGIHASGWDGYFPMGESVDQFVVPHCQSGFLKKICNFT